MNNKNILFINVDQWSGRLLGCAGNDYIMTPTIDQLARNGIRFNNCYSECPVCIPARRSLMTGLTPRSHGDRVYDDTLTMPQVTTLAQSFRNSGYQSIAVGKLHVYPQRNRIGFDEVILQEEGRYDFNEIDDYQIWLAENGYVGQEFMHGMGNNTYYTRTWPLAEKAHPTTWTTHEMVKQIRRRDPTKPSFMYISYQFPHPPLVPLQTYFEMYDTLDIEPVFCGDWVDDSFIMQQLTCGAKHYSEKEIYLAKRAYYAQCTHIDHQIRLLIGTLRECNILNNTIIAFTSDHGDMLFDHNMVAKRCFYENSCNIPFILSGKALPLPHGQIDNRIACLADIMPTLLSLCDIPIPNTVEGLSLLENTKRSTLYGEISVGESATRMARDEKYKLIYYPYGNIFHLFDMENDPNELHNIAYEEKYHVIKTSLEQFIISNLYGEDLNWIEDGQLVGIVAPEYNEKRDYNFSAQRGLHWPIPKGRKN